MKFARDEELVRKARKQRNSYCFDRYKTLAEKLAQVQKQRVCVPEEIFGGNQVLDLERAEASLAADYRDLEISGRYRLLESDSSFTTDFDCLELGYKLFLDWILDEEEKGEPFAPGVTIYHPEAMTQLVFKHEARQRGEQCFSLEENVFREVFGAIPETILNGMAWLHRGISPELYVLLLKYFPQPFPSFLTKNDFFRHYFFLDPETRERVHQQTKDKIPRFPPEVREQRLGLVTTTREVLDGLYEVLNTYCREKW